MRYLLDTNHASVLLSQPALPRQKRMDVAFLLCTPVLGELWFFVHNSRRREQNERDLRRLISAIEIISFGSIFAEEFGRIRTELRETGRAIPQIDAQLAAIARATNLPILTADRHFSFIQNLHTENWLT